MFEDKIRETITLKNDIANKMKAAMEKAILITKLNDEKEYLIK